MNNNKLIEHYQSIYTNGPSMARQWPINEPLMELNVQSIDY